MTTQWRFKNFLADHDLKPAAVVQAAEGRLSRNSIYTLARGAEAVRFETLDVLVPVLRQLTGKDVEISDLLVWEPDPVPQMDAETRAWMEADLAPPLEPYEWGPEGPPKGNPVRYVAGQGWMVYEDETV